MTRWSEYLSEDLLLELNHRQWVFTVPLELRRHFYKKRWLLNKLSNTAAHVLLTQMRVRSREAHAMGGVIAVIQTAGDALTFNPHVHLIATMHCLGPSGRLSLVPYIPFKNMKCITAEESEELWRKYPQGFNLNGEIKDTIKDREASKRLAEYLARPAMTEERVLEDDESNGMVTFKARGKKNYETGKRPPVEVTMDAAEFTARLLSQTPPKGQKLVNYYGIYSNKVRGMWKKRGFRIRLFTKRRKKRHERGGNWRRLIWKIYEVDPLICSECEEELILIDIVLPPESSLIEKPP